MPDLKMMVARSSSFVASERVSRRLADPAVQQRLTNKIKDLKRETKPLVDAIRSSERLNEKDFAIRINTKA